MFKNKNQMSLIAKIQVEDSPEESECESEHSCHSVAIFFFFNFQITHLCYPNFLATKNPNKIQTTIS